MTRLIDADALIEKLEQIHSKDFGFEMAIIGTINEVKKAPTVEAEPVKHGQWIGISDGYADGFPVYDEWECSVCGVVYEDEQPPYKYCPCCGAKMDEGKEG